jgi:peptidyl-prolyl cis-trans isomerase A (cyclophilin A)
MDRLSHGPYPLATGTQTTGAERRSVVQWPTAERVELTARSRPASKGGAFAVKAARALTVITGLAAALVLTPSTWAQDQAAPKPTATPEVTVSPALLDPKAATETAPETYKVKLETTKGDVVVEVTRAWSPNGADRFYNLVKLGYYDDAAFFRVISGFMAQIGINGDPKVNAAWRKAGIPDDPVVKSNTRGMVTFAMSSEPNSRTTQIFFNFSDGNKQLDAMRFAPFGKVVQGMDVVDALYSGYGEGAPQGRGPSQQRVQLEGNAYLKSEFPKLDYIPKATILK